MADHSRYVESSLWIGTRGYLENGASMQENFVGKTVHQRGWTEQALYGNQLYYYAAQPSVNQRRMRRWPGKDKKKVDAMCNQQKPRYRRILGTSFGHSRTAAWIRPEGLWQSARLIVERIAVSKLIGLDRRIGSLQDCRVFSWLRATGIVRRSILAASTQCFPVRYILVP